MADAVTRFSGSFVFIQIHIVWFTTWIVLNLIAATRFDKFPFGLLTLIVSLEAIFLSTFVLMSQNRGAERDAEREEDDLRVSVLTRGVGRADRGQTRRAPRRSRARGSGAPARQP